MQSRLIKVLILAATGGFWLVPGPAGAEMYKWTDADGKVHFSDQPPPASIKNLTTIKRGKPAGNPPPAASESDSDSVKPDPAAEKAKAAAPKTYVEKEMEFKKRQVEKAEREAAEKKKNDEAEAKKRNCDQSRAQLKSLQAGGRITQANAQGETEVLNDAQIAKEIERAKKSVADWCK